MEVNLNLTTPDGKPAEALAKVIEARRKELGETTRQSCIAVASNILRSLRAQTKVAKEGKMDITVRLSDDKYFPSFRRPRGAKGKRVSERVLRNGPNGPVVKPDKVVWRLDDYSKGQQAHSYEIEDKIGDGKTLKYIIVASSQAKATKYARDFHKSRVRQHKGLAKHALGLAMKAIYDKGSPSETVNQEVSKLAKQNVEAVVRESGFNQGDVQVRVHDKLDYATPALQNGSSSVTTAMKNAVNKMFGLLKSRVKAAGGNIDQSLKTTVDQFIDRGAS